MKKGVKIRFEIHKILFDIYKFSKTLNNNKIKSRISKYKDATVNYRPLIQFFENKWKLSHKNATVVPIT